MSRSKNVVQRVCSYPGCGRNHYAKGLCKAHYVMSHVRKQVLRCIYPNAVKPVRKCSFSGCEHTTTRAYCNTHESRIYRHGDVNISLKRGVKSQGGHQQYPNHSLLKRNRLIKLAQNPICEFCGKAPSKIVHHRDGKKTDHSLENLYAVCGGVCHSKEHKLLKLGIILTDTFDKLLEKFEKIEKKYI